ncbi:penicillin-binding protein 1A [Comamonas testosteroni]|uniref:Penicillin-binding protein 1A n=1 Tax=Comamonas testosteroni TaxID=285 RepID=A0A8B4S0J3_COMTE|nr:transglycosylase domain-containing protein [Comamonas testosteroni]EHN67762.1 glycosyl transferase, family 51 [Comamonas testosteroni ATCC 11996]QQN72248.1 transglycosylase domain-containing protein [Comamonas testosteroni]SUY74481.1 Penicillin-binding protein 1A [Comamonas testosteroni]
MRARASTAGQRIAALPWWRRWPTRREWLWFAAALPVLFVVYVLLLIPFTPSISDIRKAKLEQPAQILSADGKLIGEFKRSNRQWVPLEQISPAVVKALVATEDHRFYEHHGMDFTRTVGSVIHTLGGNPQGGSTITQQLARNLYPTEIGRARNVNRKLKEAITAFKIEALYTKDEILETYLNTVPFLYNAYGIEMAARTYFDKPAARLTVLESATLVGMLKGNAYYNPVINPDRAIARRNTVLSQMVKRGELKDDEFERLKKRPMRLDFERQEEPTGMAPHFSQQLRKWLIAWADKHDYNIYTDGLVVRTTLDSRLQTWAQQAVNRQMHTLQGIANNNWSHRDGWSAENALVLQLVRETEAFRKLARSGRPSDISEEEALKKLLADKAFMRQLREDKTRVQAGFLAIDPRTSAVLAWVGSRDYAQDAFDHVAQARRQPGSTFKPFVYGAALQRGARPDDTRKDEAVEIQLPGGEVWRPSDAVEPTGVPMKLSDALAYSKNTITAELGQEVGMDRVIKLARALGVRQSPLEPVPSLALGSSPVTLLEMVNAYGSIANSGHYIPPQLVTRIENADGELLAEFTPPKPDQVWDEEENYGLLEMMRAVIDKGTGRAIRKQYGIRADVAGKTGTTQGNADGWFILMHPQIVAGAWAGFNDARITLRSDQWGQGSRSALPMVGDFMSRAMRSPLLNAKARFTEPNTSHWWSDLVGRLRDKVQEWSGPAAEGNDPDRTAPTTPAHPAPNRSNGSEVDIIESTPAAPPSTAVQPAPADSSAQPPDLDSSPGLAPGEMMPAPARTPAPSSWSDIGTPLPPAAPLNAPQDNQ